MHQRQHVVDAGGQAALDHRSGTHVLDQRLAGPEPRSPWHALFHVFDVGGFRSPGANQLEDRLGHAFADGNVAVVLPVGLDHAEYLGEDITDIAREKAGIIKEGSVAVLAAQDKRVAEILLERCAEVGAQVARESAEFGVVERELAVGGQRLELQGLSGRYDEIFLPLHGEHQASNAAVALAAAEALVGAGTAQPLDPGAVRAAFASVRSPGRLEPVEGGPDRPTVLLDAAHNPAGATALAAALGSEFRFTRLVGVIGVLEGKDARGILEALRPALHEVVVTSSSSPP